MPRMNRLTGNGALWTQVAVHKTGVNNVSTGLTTATTTQATSAALANDINVFATVASTAGTKLPADLVPGESLVVVNGGANSLSVWPNSGGNINALGADTAYAVAVNKSATFLALTNLTFVATGG